MKNPMIKRIGTLLLGIGLIGLGVLFFLAPQGSVAIQLLSRYWPVFLILAGIVRVASYLIDRHPKSPVSGMLIIAIGGVLLSANLLGHSSFLLLFAKYWFWFLLAFIAGRVMKQYLHRTSSGTIRPRAFAPVALLGMLLIVAGGLTANYFVKHGRAIDLRLGQFGEVGDFIFGDERSVEDQPPQTFTLTSDARLIFNNIKADIEINSAPQSQATARIIKRVRATSEEDAREIARNIRLQIASDDDNYQFSISRGEKQQDFNATIILTLPQQFASHLEINNLLGDVKLHDLRGNHAIRDSNRVEVERNQGRVTIENPRGDVELKHIQDEVSISNAHRHVTVQNTGGKVSLDLKGGSLTAENIAGPLQIRASDARLEIHNMGNESGEQPVLINLSEVRNCRIELQEITGNISITAERSRIEATGVNGDFKVHNSGDRIVASRIKGSLQIKAEDGAVELDEIRGPASIDAERDIRVSDFYGPMQVNSERGTISLETDQQLKNDLKATSERGRIRVSIPQNSQFRFDVSTTRGRVQLGGFEQMTLQRKERSTALGYNLSDSSPLVSLRASHGNIQLQSSGLALATTGDNPEKE